MAGRSSKLDIIIVGAGLGGLAAAVSCAIAGHRVSVYEGARQLAEIGAGLQLTPNATRLLGEWGLSPDILRVGAEPTRLVVHRYSDGKVLAEDPSFDKEMHNKYNAPFLDIHRVDLQRMLYDKALSLGVKITLASRVARVESTETSSQVVFESGNSVYGDLVVGADGLWSKCRTSVLGKACDPVPTGDLAYRIVLELDQLEDPELRDLVSKPECHFWIGPGAHAVGYSLRAGTQYNLVLLCPSDLPDEVMRTNGSVEEMRELFSNWDHLLTRFLDHVDTVDKWKLMYLNPIQTWTNPQKRIILIGDSCHPMLPYLAQGANSSLEDGAVLGRILSHVQSTEQIPWAVELYQSVRKPRSERIVRETFHQREAFHMQDGQQQEDRDALFASCLGKPITQKFPSRW